MSEPTRVWAISSGFYSDYSVAVLFTDKKVATEAAALASDGVYDNYRVEEFTLYDEVPERVTVWTMMEIINHANPSFFSRTQAESETQFPWEFWDGVPYKAKVSQKKMGYQNKETRLMVKGVDRQAVYQAFSDRRTMILDKLVNP